MQYTIAATFLDDTGYKTGLSPVIKIRQRDDVNHIYIDKIDTVMVDKGEWDYIYEFIEYEKSKLYTYKIDAWTDDVVNRYATGNNELDFYSNKQDRGNMIRGAFIWYDENIKKVIRDEIKKIEFPKQEVIDLSPILTKIDSIQIPDYNDKIEELALGIEFIDNNDDKKELADISSTLDKNSADLIRVNNENWQIISNLVEQIKEDKELIKEMWEYIKVLVKRWNVGKDKDFKEMIKEAEEEQKNIDNLLENMVIFNSLLD